MSQYPKEMRHPAFVPATLSGYRRGDGGATVDDARGSPQRFAPVFVNNKDQEEYYASRGYIPLGVTDAELYKRELVGDLRDVKPDPNYPAWLYEVGEDGMMNSTLVRNESEKNALVGEWFSSRSEASASFQKIDARPESGKPESRSVVEKTAEAWAPKKRGRPSKKLAAHA